MDVWIGPGAENAQRCLNALADFGFGDVGLTLAHFEYPRAIFRMGVPPLRLELLTSVSGLEFAKAYARRKTVEWDGIQVNLVSLADLRVNKRAGRHKDLDDLEHLPE